MAEFPIFSLGKAMQQGQTLAMNQMKVDELGQKKARESKAGALKQRIYEGDSEAMGELLQVDSKEAESFMNFLNTADDRDREALKAQNEATIKAVTWVMDAPTEGERASRWDQSVDHMVKNQGNKDAEQYRGQYSQENAQKLLMQALPIDEFLGKQKGSFGTPQKGVDKDGNPAFFVTNKKGNKKILKDVQPADAQVFGKSGKSGKGGIKASDSNAIAKRSAEYFNVPFTKNSDGSISYEFPTSNEAQKAVRAQAEAERILAENPGIGHARAFLKAIDKEKGKPLKETPAKKGREGIKSYLDSLKSGG